MKPKRVFILGLQRSGTTWLANMLAALPQVAAVAHESHRGVHESVFFSHFAKAFEPWDDPEQRLRFADSFAASDYYLLTEMEQEFLEDIERSCSSYGEVFIALMDYLAIAEGVDAWIEKSPHHTLLDDEILTVAPDAVFVMVERNSKDLIRSRLQGFGRGSPKALKRQKDIFRGAFTTTLYQRHMRKLAKKPNALLVKYEALRDDNDLSVRSKVIDHIGITADPAEMVSEYSANTSFDKAPRKEWSGLDSFTLALGLTIAKLLPLGTLRNMQRRREEDRGIVFPEWVWTMHPEAREATKNAKNRVVLDEMTDL